MSCSCSRLRARREGSVGLAGVFRFEVGHVSAVRNRLSRSRMQHARTRDGKVTTSELAEYLARMDPVDGQVAL